MSYDGLKVCVVVPARNEAPFIGQVIASIPAWIDGIIVVDDASTDGTDDIVRGCRDPRLRLVRLPFTHGVGGTMTAGYREALAAGYDIIAKMDGDGQMPPEYLPDLVAPLTREGFAYAKGNRFLGGLPTSHMPRKRLLGNIVLTFLTKAASGYWNIFDPQNGYTAITAHALRRINLNAVDQGYFFENDMLVQMNLSNLRIKDVQIPAQYGHEISGIRPLYVGLSFPFLLFRKFLYRIYEKYILRDFSPIALFLITGSLLFLWGLSFGIFLWVRSKALGVPAATGTIMLAIVPLILGFQLLLQAIVLDIQETPR